MSEVRVVSGVTTSFNGNCCQVDDGELLVIKQHEPFSGDDDREVLFGPCRTTLFNLMDEGFYFVVRISWYQRKTDRKVKLYLERGSERYKVAQKRASTFIQAKDLIQFLGHYRNLLNRHVPVEVKRDPWEILHEKYPRKVKKKPLPMVGNRTMREVVQDVLSE